MSYQKERDAFMAEVGPILGTQAARGLLRCATTLQRLAEAQCNGDWPCDNGERKVVPCPECASHYVPSQIRRGACPDCRAEERARQLVAGSPYQIGTQGDPRGAVLSLYPATATAEEIDRGSARRIYVPTR